MKISTFTIALVLTSLISSAQTTNCASFFRRNNGNGACADGQLKLYFTTCPAVAPIIDSVLVNGVKANIVFATPDASKCSSQGYIGYCVIGGNMPPASLWDIYFHNPGSTTGFACSVPEGAVLPIGLKTFGAARNGNSVVLNWQTSYESNAQGIEIQKKSNGVFVTVGVVAASNSLTGSTYTFTDKNNAPTISEYRLRLLSKDAEAAFSEIKAVKGFGMAPDFTVYPNPAVRNARIAINDISTPTDIQVIDNVGRVVKSLIVANSNTVELNNLQVGIYRIRLVDKVSGSAVTKSLTVIQ
ncbi:MAG: T9SS type A sorting domain-containing protein [Bacteroidota bacterium]